jgi:hypothetical protein
MSTIFEEKKIYLNDTKMTNYLNIKTGRDNWTVEDMFGAMLWGNDRLFDKNFNQTHKIAEAKYRVISTTVRYLEEPSSEIFLVLSKMGPRGMWKEAAFTTKESLSKKMIREAKTYGRTNLSVCISITDNLYFSNSWAVDDMYAYLQQLVSCVVDRKEDGTIFYNEENNLAVINTRLMDRWGNFIIIVINSKDWCIQGARLANIDCDLQRLGFDVEAYKVRPITFFKNPEDIVFNGEVDLSNSYRYQHIFEERLDRLPDIWRNLDGLNLAMRVRQSVEFAIRLSQIDYKFLVPIYNPKSGNIQFLVPLYYEFGTDKEPAAALVLSRQGANVWQVSTILSMEDARWDAKFLGTSSEWLGGGNN